MNMTPATPEGPEDAHEHGKRWQSMETNDDTQGNMGACGTGESRLQHTQFRHDLRCTLGILSNFRLVLDLVAQRD